MSDASSVRRSFKTKANKNDHELGCALNPDREELKCEVCNLGGFYVNREYWTTRESVTDGINRRRGNDMKRQKNIKEMAHFCRDLEEP